MSGKAGYHRINQLVRFRRSSKMAEIEINLVPVITKPGKVTYSCTLVIKSGKHNNKKGTKQERKQEQSNILEIKME